MTTTTSKFMVGALVGTLSFVLGATGQSSAASADGEVLNNPALEWNQIFIDTLVATNTANSSSPRLGAIVHTAIFDAYNGIERRYTPIFVHPGAPLAHRAGLRSSPPRIRRWSTCSPPGKRNWIPAMPRRWRRWVSRAWSMVDRSSVGSRGEPRSHRQCWPGARTMVSVSATRPFQVAWRSVSGGQCHPQPR